jgi:hypothetical protein
MEPKGGSDANFCNVVFIEGTVHQTLKMFHNARSLHMVHEYRRKADSRSCISNTPQTIEMFNLSKEKVRLQMDSEDDGKANS